MDTQTLSNISQVVVAVISFAMMIIVWRQLIINSDQIKIMKSALIADHERRRKQSTIEYVNDIRGKYVPISRRLEEKFSWDHVINLKEIDEFEQRDIREFLAIVEHMAVGVETEVYDVDIINRMSGRYFLRMRRILDPYIAHAQSKNPTSYIEYDRICERIRAKRATRSNVGRLPLPTELC